jgi:hypothetical protein
MITVRLGRAYPLLFDEERKFKAMSDHSTPAASGQSYFSHDEWNTLHSEDVRAGKAVVGLMVAIFSIGLLLYIGVMVSVM